MIAGVASNVPACAWQAVASDAKSLAVRLADPQQREKAIAALSASDEATRALLLKWTTNPPPDVDEFHLSLGLIDAFGHLRIVEAIPYLIQRINRRPHDVGIWGASAAFTLNASPAMRGLLQIGEPAIQPLIRAYYAPASLEDRIAIVFTVAYMRSPKTAEFFRRVKRAAAVESHYADVGLMYSEAASGEARQ